MKQRFLATPFSLTYTVAGIVRSRLTRRIGVTGQARTIILCHALIDRDVGPLLPRAATRPPQHGRAHP